MRFHRVFPAELRELLFFGPILDEQEGEARWRAGDKDNPWPRRPAVPAGFSHGVARLQAAYVGLLTLVPPSLLEGNPKWTPRLLGDDRKAPAGAEG